MVTVGSVATTVLAVLHPSIFAWAITAWLWFTVVFANLAEAVAEGRGKAQAASLREVKRDTVARRLVGDGNGNENEEEVPGSALRPGDRVVVVCRSDDCACGGCFASEDPQRDRTQHLAGIAHHHFLAGGCRARTHGELRR
ncbi:potassium-transporting ATPase subunit B [Mycobacteroides abscessus subsp. abscessus]|nr:potassium-transporting ATPase subunit B [Mycobacteroides abscessus subsp. abscessus]